MTRDDASPTAGNPSPSGLPSPSDGAERRRMLRLEMGISVLWGLNFVLMIGLALWVFLDASFPHAVRDVYAQLGSLLRAPTEPLPPTDLAVRVAGLYAVAIGAAVSLAGVALALVTGPPKHRGVRSWLALTALVAAWLALALLWPDLAWQGQQRRIEQRIAAIEPAAATLRQQWPADDGQREPIGAFMAYPQPNPTMLLILKAPAGETARLFSAVERSPQGALRFELMGPGGSDWLEWHPAGSEPTSFIGGLQGDYQLIRKAALGEGWYAARYHNAGPSEAP